MLNCVGVLCVEGCVFGKVLYSVEAWLCFAG